MPDTITYGHVPMAAALLVALAALAAAWSWYRHRGHGRGTPQYARGRVARRGFLCAVPAALLLFAIGCFTPLAELPLVSTR